MRRLSIILLAPLVILASFAVLFGVTWLFIIVFPPMLFGAALVAGLVISVYGLVRKARQMLVEHVRLPEVILNYMSGAALNAACVCVNETQGKVELVARFGSGENSWSHRFYGKDIPEAVSRLSCKLVRQHGRSVDHGAKPCANWAHCPHRKVATPARELFRHELHGHNLVNA